jgi:clan AA aspartic protease (TIGR02281 family)
MLVGVRLNNSVTAPFLIDTGASDVLIPKKYADQLGFSEGRNTRTKRYSTANGIITRPVMMLRSVSLGGAKVENVPASVTPDMQFGLLGLSFFNHFTYNIDAAEGIVTLVPNSLAATGAIRGGRSQAQWKSEYRNLTARIAMLDAEAERTPSTRSRERSRLATARSDLERQLELLNGEADQARVPMAWRD